MATLDRLPPLATTGVGSLPFDDPAAAVRHAARAYDLPFCPQLPALDGDMVREWLGGDPRRCGWSPGRDRQRPAAWDAFTALLAADPPAGALVKLQVTGPVTLAVALGGTDLAGEIAQWLQVSVAAQVERLRSLGLDTLLVVDEPGLAGQGRLGLGVWDRLRETGAVAWGLHICGPVPWALIDAVDADLLSFDLTRTPLEPHARRALRRLVRRGGRVAWGALDPVDPGTSGDAAALVAAALHALAGDGLDVDAVAARSLLTPACGTGGLTPAAERLLAARLAGAADGLRAALRAGIDVAGRTESGGGGIRTPGGR
jgi:hypothetical protein